MVTKPYASRRQSARNRNAKISPNMTIASATSSLHASAMPAATANHPQRCCRAAQYANNNGPIATASGWKNSHINHWYVGLSSSATASATPHQRDRSTSRPNRNIAHRATRLGDELHAEQHLDAAAESVQRRDGQQDHVHVVAEDVEAAHCDERIAKLRKEPHALVVDTEVETECLEPVVPQQRQAPEPGHPHHDAHEQHGASRLEAIDRAFEHASRRRVLVRRRMLIVHGRMLIGRVGRDGDIGKRTVSCACARAAHFALRFR